MIDRIGMQGDAMSVSVCTENPMIDDDIKLSQALSDDGEMIGERLRVISRLLKEMGYQKFLESVHGLIENECDYIHEEDDLSSTRQLIDGGKGLAWNKP